jgi:hypothetical protein
MNKWKETVSILLIVSCFLTLIHFVLPKSELNDEYITHIPKTTSTHYLLNTPSLFKDILFNELFIHKDDLIIAQIKDILSKKVKTKTDYTDLSIDFNEPLEIIRFSFHKKTFAALKYKISNPKTFDQNNELLGKELAFRDENVGFIVFDATIKIKIPIKKMLTTNLVDYHIKDKNSKLLVSVFVKSKLESITTFNLKKNELIVEKTSLKNKPFHRCLKPQGFHLSTSVTNYNSSELFDNATPQLIRIKDLNYVSLNYMGLNFIESNELPAMPQFEIYFNYTKRVVGDSIVCSIIKKFNLPFRYDKVNSFTLRNGMGTIKLNQLDSNSFIVSSINSNFQLSKTNINPYLSGDPKNIVKVTNAGWKGLFLELIPGYKATKNMLETTKKVDTYKDKKTGKEITHLTFKNEEDALHSLLKFALTFK